MLRYILLWPAWPIWLYAATQVYPALACFAQACCCPATRSCAAALGFVPTASCCTCHMSGIGCFICHVQLPGRLAIAAPAAVCLLAGQCTCPLSGGWCLSWWRNLCWRHKSRSPRSCDLAQIYATGLARALVCLLRCHTPGPLFCYSFWAWVCLSTGRAIATGLWRVVGVLQFLLVQHWLLELLLLPFSCLTHCGLVLFCCLVIRCLVGMAVSPYSGVQEIGCKS